MSSSIYFATLVEWMGVIAVTMILSLSPRFVRRPLLFKYPRREGLVSLGVVVLGAVLAVLAFATVLSGRMGYAIPGELPLLVENLPEGITSLAATGTAALMLVLALPAAAALGLRGQPLLSAGMSRPTVKPALQLGLALLLITILLTNRTRYLLDGVTAGEGLGLLIALVTAFSEEFLFRGYALPRLSAWLGDRPGWVVSTLLYTLWKLPAAFAFSAGGAGGLAANIVYIFLFGLLLGWIQRKSGNILAGGLYHTAHNWVQILGLF